jgi:hypothetical protein
MRASRAWRWAGNGSVGTEPMLSGVSNYLLGLRLPTPPRFGTEGLLGVVHALERARVARRASYRGNGRGLGTQNPPIPLLAAGGMKTGAASAVRSWPGWARVSRPCALLGPKVSLGSCMPWRGRDTFGRNAGTVSRPAPNRAALANSRLSIPDCPSAIPDTHHPTPASRFPTPVRRSPICRIPTPVRRIPTPDLPNPDSRSAESRLPICRIPTPDLPNPDLPIPDIRSADSGHPICRLPNPDLPTPDLPNPDSRLPTPDLPIAESRQPQRPPTERRRAYCRPSHRMAKMID